MPFKPRVSQKQAAIINDPKMYPLVTGPRNSSKSRGILHSIPWRMWNINNYVGCMIGCSTAQNAISGLWSVLTESVMPDWIEGKMYDDAGNVVDYLPFGLEWIIPPKMEMLTHRLMMSCTNKFGGESKYYLDSLKVESEVWERFRGKQFADLYITETDNFRSRRTFDCLVECLRDYPRECRRLICDTNPPDTAEEHWLYRLFFWFREIDLGSISEDQKTELSLDGMEGTDYESALTGLKELQAELSVHRLSVADNCFISEKDKRAQFARYAHDKDLLRRMFFGEWTRSTGEGFFSEVLSPELHFIGDSPTPLDPEPDILLPDPGCFEIGVGFDMGSSRNTSISFVEPILVDSPATELALAGVLPHFRLIDEFVEVGMPQDIERIAEVILDKADFWEEILGRKLIFDCWSDTSAFSPNLISSDTTEAKELYRLTGGRFNLKSVSERGMDIKIKGHGGVKRGIDLIFRLLFQHRLVVGRAKCPEHIKMLTGLKPWRDGKLSAGHPLKHPLDSLRYYLSAKCWQEMQTMFRHRTKNEVARVLTTSL